MMFGSRQNGVTRGQSITVPADRGLVAPPVMDVAPRDGIYCDRTGSACFQYFRGADLPSGLTWSRPIESAPTNDFAPPPRLVTGEPAAPALVVNIKSAAGEPVPAR